MNLWSPLYSSSLFLLYKCGYCTLFIGRRFKKSWTKKLKKKLLSGRRFNWAQESQHVGSSRWVLLSWGSFRKRTRKKLKFDTKSKAQFFLSKFIIRLDKINFCFVFDFRSLWHSELFMLFVYLSTQSSSLFLGPDYPFWRPPYFFEALPFFEDLPIAV